MKKLLISFLLFQTVNAFAQNFTISGYIRDADTGENLIGATVYEASKNIGTTTNLYGYYSITLPQGNASLNISYVGYKSEVIDISVSDNISRNITLTTDFTLEEVVVTAEPEIAQKNQMSEVKLSAKQAKALPAFMGEVDILKTIQLLPGIQSGNEGSSGIYVRGGGPDQNLILLDGVPVYNVSHLFGFFSVFNADAINNVNVIKGGFPARYGGRLSSVIDISMKEGNNQKFQGEGSIGLISSKLTLEGPIKSEKTSFIISGRRTYIDLLARPIIKSASGGNTTFGYFFYDLNAKVNHRFSDKDRIYVSAYTGTDRGTFSDKYSYISDGQEYKYKDKGGLDWGNITTALRWNHVYSPKLFGNVTATFSKYQFDIFNRYEEEVTGEDGTETETYEYQYLSGIRDFAMKADFDYDPHPNHKFKTGVSATAHQFKPGAVAFKDVTNDTIVGAKSRNAIEYFGYVEDDIKISNSLKVNAGIHYSGFYVSEKLYQSVQPRVSARYLLNSTTSLKGSFVKMTQFIHLLTNSGIGLPTDLWVPSTEQIKPQNAWQYAVGFAKNFNKGYEFSAEAYYKEMENLIEYKEGSTYLNVSDSWENKITAGTGDSYGFELFINKTKGKFTGWIGYTWSKTYRAFPEIDDGKRFPYRYDRRHDIAITSVYEIKENLTVSGTWVYGSGNSVSLPISRYKRAEGDSFWWNEVENYNGRNGFRMRAYHRLDLSISKTKKTKWGEQTWSFGTYNTYSRANPFFVDLSYDRQGNKKFVQYSIFPILPFIRYTFKF